MPFPPLLAPPPLFDASGAGSIRNAMQAAANQQATQQRLQNNAQAVQAHQGLLAELEAYKMGGIPVKGPGDPNYPVTDPGGSPNDPDPPPTLKGLDPNRQPMGYNRPGFEKEAAAQAAKDAANPPAAPAAPAAQPRPSSRDVSRMTQINGKWFYFPNEEEQGKTMRFSPEKVEEAHKAGITNLQADHDYPAGLLQHLNETIAQYHRATDPKAKPRPMAAPAGVYKDSQGNQRPGFIDPDTLQFVPVTNVGGGGLPGGAFDGAAAQPNAAPAQSASAFPFTPPDQAAAQAAQPAAPPLTDTNRPTLQRREPGDTSGGLPGGAFDGTAPAPQATSAFTFEPPPKAPKALHYVTSTDKDGNVTTQAFDEQGNLTKTSTAHGIGRPMRAAGAGRGAAGAPKPMTDAAERSIRSTKDKVFDKANEVFKKALADPLITDDALKEAVAARHTTQRTAQGRYEQNVRKATHNDDLPHFDQIDEPDWTDELFIDKATGKVSGWPTPQAAQPNATPAQPPVQPSTAPAKPAQQAGTAAPEGTIVTNPATKQRMIKRGGKWQPLQ
jgi:YD repeat-containing protein